MSCALHLGIGQEWKKSGPSAISFCRLVSAVVNKGGAAVFFYSPIKGWIRDNAPCKHGLEAQLLFHVSPTESVPLIM